MIQRRDFLKFSLLSVCAPVLLGVHRAAGAVGSRVWNSVPLPPGEQISVGYWQGNKHLTFLDATPAGVETLSFSIEDVHLGKVAKDLPLSAHLISAEKLTVGDPQLIERGVKLTIHGMVGVDDEWQEDGLRALHLLVKFKRGDAASAWQAWSLERSPVLNVSSAVTAVIPVDQNGLELVAEMVSGRDGQAETNTQVPIVLTVADEPFKPKLRRGIYFIAVNELPGQPLPSWGRCRVVAARVQNEKSEGLTLTLGSRGPAFAKILNSKYLVFSIDYVDDA